MAVRPDLGLMLALLAAAPAAAQTFGLPQGCTAYVTIQKQSCEVTHQFRCAGDPAGQQRRVTLDATGPTSFGIIDDEAQWVETWRLPEDTVERLLPGAADPASLTTLFASGRDDVAFSTMTDDSYETRFTGFDRLTGKPVVIDGVTLDQTAFLVIASDPGGVELWRSEGHEYVSRDWRSFVSGVTTITTPTDSWQTDRTPVEFIFPGEPGFLSSVPRHGCGEVTSRAGQLPPADFIERL